MKFKTIIGFSLGPIGSAIIGLVSVPIIAWLYNPIDVGRYAMLQAVINFAVLFLTLGLDQAYVREYFGSSNRKYLFRLCLVPGVIFSLVTSLVVLLLPWSISEVFFDLTSLEVSVLVMITVIINFFIRYISLKFRMEERGVEYSLSLIFPKIFLLLVILIYWITDVDLDFETLLVANVISFLLVMIFMISMTFKSEEKKDDTQSKRHCNSLKEMFRYSLPLLFSATAFSALISVDRFFIRSMSTYDELALFSVSISFAGAAVIFQSIFSTIWAPVVYKWSSHNDGPVKIEKSINTITCIMLCVWSISGALSWVIPYFLPNEYSNVELIFISVMAYPILYTISEATSIGINIQRKTGYILIVTFISLITNIVLNYVLIPSYGALGAATSTAISFYIYFALKTYISFKIYISFQYAKGWFLVTIFSIVNILPITPYSSLVVTLNLVLFVVTLFCYHQDIKYLVRSGLHYATK